MITPAFVGSMETLALGFESSVIQVIMDLAHLGHSIINTINFQIIEGTLSVLGEKVGVNTQATWLATIL
jgi:hypothetical protein